MAKAKKNKRTGCGICGHPKGTPQKACPDCKAHAKVFRKLTACAPCGGFRKKHHKCKQGR